MTAIDQVKKRLWMSDYKVVDVTDLKFVNAYDLVVESIYRVAVRTKKLSTDFDGMKIDVLAVVDGKQIIFHKSPWVLGKKLLAEVTDTSPIRIFIKHERKHTNNILRGKKAGAGKTSTRNKRTK